MPRSIDLARAARFAALAALCGALAGCYDYLDRREGITLGAGDAVATNIAVQTIDPWPPASARRTMPANGQVVAGAVHRYNTGKVTPPQGTSTSAVVNAQPSAAPGVANP